MFHFTQKYHIHKSYIRLLTENHVLSGPKSINSDPSCLVEREIAGVRDIEDLT